MKYVVDMIKMNLYYWLETNNWIYQAKEVVII